jgi:hypothetical protein
MKKRSFLLLAFMLFLVGCQTATSEPIPTDTASPPTPVVEPTAEVVVEVDYCISCHADKDQLIATAKPEEVVEEESSGVG